MTAPLHPQRTDTIFYDGDCGLCHRGVRFVMNRDADGKAFRFAPLSGKTFSALSLAALPDTMVVQTRDGRVLLQSSAWAYILQRLGGGWRLVAAVLRVIPRPIRDAVYAWVARVRHRLFSRPAETCPVASPLERARFDP